MTADPREQTGASSAPRIGRLAGAAMLLSASFVLSRVVGLIRFTVVTSFFGINGDINAYWAAFNIPDTMFTLVSGAALTSAFVPTFAGLLQEGEDDEAWDVASTVLTSVLLLLALAAAVAFVLAPQIMGFFVSGLPPAERALSVHLTRIMLLQPILLGVAAVISGILQTRNQFLLTAIAPLAYNLATIVGVLIFGSSHGVDVLAWSVVAGALLYLVIQLPDLRRAPLRLHSDWRQPAAREVLRLFGPRVVGLAAFRVMLLITVKLASGLPDGSIAAVTYAWTLIQFPVGALGTAAGTAILPTLSRLRAADDLTALRRTLNRSLRLVIFLSLPAAMGLIVARRPIINLLADHGAWTHSGTEQTAFALIFFALAIGPLAVIEILARVFYAMKDTATPVRIALVAVVLDAILSILFVHVFPRASGQGGLALATAIANTAQAVWLAAALEPRLGGIGRRPLTATLRHAGAASLMMGLTLYILLDPLTAIFPQSGLGVLATVVIEVGLGSAIYVGATYALRAPELAMVLAYLPGKNDERGASERSPLPP